MRLEPPPPWLEPPALSPRLLRRQPPPLPLLQPQVFPSLPRLVLRGLVLLAAALTNRLHPLPEPQPLRLQPVRAGLRLPPSQLFPARTSFWPLPQPSLRWSLLAARFIWRSSFINRFLELKSYGV
jgi:hypothetical protein